jgi:two-component system sensor histidine kinase DegS
MSSLNPLLHSELNEASNGLEQELHRVRDEIDEVRLLIRQSRGETETLTRRDTQMSNRLRQIEANLENYSRAEIREVYNVVRESQLRLFLMRSQIEQLEHKQATLDNYAQSIEKIMALLQSLDTPQLALPPAAHTSTSLTAQQTIIRIIDAQEKERQMLARQMHDGPASSLSNLVLQAEVVERMLADHPEQARQELDELKTAVNSTFQRTRDFIFNLRPMMLDDLGLFPTLRRYVEDYQERTKVNAQLTVMGKDRRLPAHMEVILFRVIQELLTNVDRHAHANRVKISLDVGDTTVNAVVEDDGIGFDVQQVLSDSRAKKTLGIGSMIERVEMLGGDLHFESTIGHGTRASVKVTAVT